MTTSLAINENYCRDCGTVIKSQAEICPKCGVRQRTPVFATARNRTSAALLAFFLGGLGAHRFYLGQGGLGVLYLLFCWTFVPAIAGVIEGIVFLSMSDAGFNARYNVA
ncbi:MAG TPA: NINE protein [Thermoanaerobaculia bacterium]|jgi:TM2 domain-containing membrane protein YozV|nr:NINE protein [Thermoanaerobaculia bacterium]